MLSKLFSIEIEEYIAITYLRYTVHQHHPRGHCRSQSCPLHRLDSQLVWFQYQYSAGHPRGWDQCPGQRRHWTVLWHLNNREKQCRWVL